MSVTQQLTAALRYLEKAGNQAAAFYADHGSSASENVLACVDEAIRNVKECIEFYAEDLDKQIAVN